MRLLELTSAIAIVVSAGETVSAAPLLTAAISTASGTATDATPVGWRGHYGGGAGEPYPNYGYYPPRSIGPTEYGAPGREAYCSSRYRSSDPVSGTYWGRNGRRHYCR
ncbi:BA14K family protein [Bradyrhizobium sp. JR3.5]